MLKACWDCIVGSGVLKDRVENEDVYGTELNGETQRAPPWPEPQSNNEIMFLLPRILNPGDQVNIFGTINNNPNGLTVSLVTGNSSPDYQNIACQLEAKFPSVQSNENNISLKIVQNGYHEIVNGDYQSIPATDMFIDLNFQFSFKVTISGNYQGGHILDIYVGDSFLERVMLKHNIGDVRFISLSGDIGKVHKLDFQFA